MAFTGMNPTEVLRYIHRSIGNLVYDIELTDEEIMNVVFQETLPTFSKYFPYMFRSLLSEKDEVVAGSCCYTIPNVDGLRVLGISKVYLGDYYNYNVNLMPASSDPFEMQTFANYRSMTQTPVTWHFYAPNKVEIYPRLYLNMRGLVLIKAVHPRHLATIPTSLRDQFCQLALLDVLESLYPIRKRFENISSPYGNIQLFMDQVERAHEERLQLLEKFHENILNRGDAFRIRAA